MGLKRMLGFGDDEGYQCEDDPQTGIRMCRSMQKHGNNKLAKGSEWNLSVDNQCNVHTIGKFSVFEDDEQLVAKSKRQAKADCMGGSSIN